MQTIEVVVEGQVIVEKLFTKVTPWVGEDFCSLFRSHITVLYVSSQLVNMVNPLLSDKYSTTF